MKILISICLSLISLTFLGQDPTVPSDLYGDDLKQWLKNNWYSPWSNIISYSEAREEMYSYIDNEDGLVYCVYTGFNQNSEFTSFLDPINCEHTVPQSFFNELSPMKSDIHHLYPTHGNVNSARGNLPFIEANDNSTDTWYVGDESDIYDSSSIPSVSIDSYSEVLTNVGFEPREDHKGDVARSVFYFYTMYPTQAGPIEDLAEPDLLYQWHLDDPVDDDEYTRDEKIQEVQGNFNPYVRDPNLVGRAWGYIFPSVEENTIKEIKVYPNPVEDLLIFDIDSNENKLIYLYDLQGTLIKEFNTVSNRIDVSELGSGLYMCLVVLNSEDIYRSTFIKQ